MLTDEQNKRIAENHRLIGWFVGQCEQAIAVLGSDAVHDIATDAMWLAARSYNETRGTFASWYRLKAKGRIADALKRLKPKLTQPLLIDVEAYRNKNEIDELDRSHVLNTIDKKLKWLSPREQQVIRATLNGKTLPEIARKLRVTKSRVHTLYKLAIRKLQRFYGV